MKQFFCTFFLIISGLSVCDAQFYPTQYRPPNLDWQQLSTPHFRVIFPSGEDSSAWQTGRILETQYIQIHELTGGELSNFPVILNNYNDLSNGFVTPYHFRSEIELPPTKGKTQSPKNGTWLEIVEPHELVHAMQFNNLGTYGLARVVSFFSPDLARSFLTGVPSGLLEGLAVYNETKGVVTDGGRGNYSYFDNQFNAAFNSPKRWSMGQMIHAPSYTRPFNRYYIGGYAFTNWLEGTYGNEVSKKATDFYMNFPILGYGVALRHVTGKWPGQLYDNFEKNKEKKLLQKNKSQLTQPHIVSIPFKGTETHAPMWVSDSSFVFYGSFYNARAGFYRYDLNQKHLSLLKNTNSVQDYNYDISNDRSHLIYSYYEADPIYDNTYKSELVKMDLNNGETHKLTEDGRLYAPVFYKDSLLALQPQHYYSRVVELDLDPGHGTKRSIHPIATLDDYRIIKIAQNPKDPDKLAVVVNKRGMQALWIISKHQLVEDLQKEPAISFKKGSVFDPVWHPGGNRLLFTADFTGTMNIYELNLDNHSVVQVTNSAYNAFEGSYSPGGNRIAYIVQLRNTQVPAILSRSDFYSEPVSEDLWLPTEAKNNFMHRAKLGDKVKTDTSLWKTSSYASGFSWLKPRTVLPIFSNVSNRDVYQIGAAFHSNDLLQDQAYSLGLSYLQKRVWYDFYYRNKQFYPGFVARVYSEPDYSYFPTEQPSVTQALLREKRSFSLAVPVSIDLDRNIYYSSFYIRPEFRETQIRYFELDHHGNAASNFADFPIGNLYTAFYYRVQQNFRDIQPNTGLLFFSEAEHYFSSHNLTVATADYRYDVPYSHPTALRGGLYTYVSPLRRFNQSLRIGLLGVTQSGPVFDNQNFVSDAFSEPIFPLASNLLSFNTRYTIPLYFPEKGGLLIPFYLSSIYLVGYSDTVADLRQRDLISSSRTVFGAGIRAQFQFANFSFDLGVGFGYEPTRNKKTFFVGEF